MNIGNLDKKRFELRHKRDRQAQTDRDGDWIEKTLGDTMRMLCQTSVTRLCVGAGCTFVFGVEKCLL